MPVHCGLGGCDSAAGFVPHHDDEGNIQRFHGVFQAAEHREIDDFAGRTNHKSIAESLVKDQSTGTRESEQASTATMGFWP